MFIDEARGGLEHAERSLGQFEPEQALQDFRAVLAIDPEDIEARGGSVRALWASRERERAIEEMHHLARTAPVHPAIHLAAGTLSLGLPDHPVYTGISWGSAGRDDLRAVSEFSAAVKMAPDFVSAWRGLARAHRLSWRLDEAHRVLDAAFERHRNNSQLRIERALCYYDLGRFDRARDQLGVILAAFPQNREALFVTIGLALETSDDDAVEDAVQSLSDQCPDHPLVLVHRAELQSSIATRISDPEEYLKAIDHAKALIHQAHSYVLKWPALRWSAYNLFLTSGTDAQQSLTFPFFVQRTDIGHPPSPTLLEIRGLQLAEIARRSIVGNEDDADQQAKYRQDMKLALEDVDASLVADPHYTTAYLSKADILSELGLIEEARKSIRLGSSHSPEHPHFRNSLAWTEWNAGNYETALTYFNETGNRAGIVASLRELGCFDLAEHQAREALSRSPGNVRFLLELAYCAYFEGWPFVALDRLNTVLQFSPDDSNANKYRKAALAQRRLRFPRTWQHDAEKKAIERLDENPIDYDRLDDRLGKPASPGVRASLRHLAMRQARISTWAETAGSSALFILLLMLIVVVFFSPLITFQFDQFANSWAAYGIQLAVNVGMLVFGGAVGVASYAVEDAFQLAPDRTVLASITVLTTLDLALLIWILVQDDSRSGHFALVAVASMGYLLVWAWLLLGVLKLIEHLADNAESRAQRLEPVGAIITALLDLMEILDYAPELIRRDKRKICMDLIDRVAQCLPYVLDPAADAVSIRSRWTKQQRSADRLRMAGNVAAVSDLKALVWYPKRDSLEHLRDKVSRLLIATAYGYWGDLESREPDPVVGNLIRKGGAFMRGVAIVLVPPLAVAIYQRVRGEGILDLPLVVAIVAYLGWPLLSLMWWIDPNLPNKLGALRQGQQLVDSKQPPSRG